MDKMLTKACHINVLLNIIRLVSVQLDVNRADFFRDFEAIDPHSKFGSIG